MKRVLIVNADDCNLTPGVTEAILDCHDRGILTSTTFLVNLPVEKRSLKEILARKNLGVGLHLNVTLGRPVSASRKVRSLVDYRGCFRRYDLSNPEERFPEREEAAAEYEAQVLRFRDLFGRFPTHLDTHHQLHDHPLFFAALAEAASRCGLPVRRSRLLKGERTMVATAGCLFGSLNRENYWRPEALEAVLKHLPEGVSEIMCHPGKNDEALREISSFTAGREAEWKLFRSARAREWVRRAGILLTHYGLCYTAAPSNP